MTEAKQQHYLKMITFLCLLLASQISFNSEIFQPVASAQEAAQQITQPAATNQTQPDSPPNKQPDTLSGTQTNPTALESTSRFKELFTQKKYADALISLQQNPTYDFSYFYNLAITHHALGNIGQSRAYAKKTLRLKPHDSEIQSMARYIDDEWKKKYPDSASAFASTKIELFFDRISEDELLAITGLLSFFVALMWARAYMRTRKFKEAAKHSSVWFGASTLVLAYGVLGAYRVATHYPPAAMISGQDALSGPGTHFSKLVHIPAGSIVRLRGTLVEAKPNESWQQVRISKTKNNTEQPKDTITDRITDEITEEWAWIPSAALLPL